MQNIRLDGMLHKNGMERVQVTRSYLKRPGGILGGRAAGATDEVALHKSPDTETRQHVKLTDNSATGILVNPKTGGGDTPDATRPERKASCVCLARQSPHRSQQSSPEA